MELDTSTATELIIETASYLGVESGEVPRSEVIQQATAVGYSRQEADEMLPDEPSLNVPEREPQTFGATWDVSGSEITFHGEKETEPLDENSEDHYGFQEPIATDVNDIENDLYVEDGEPITTEQATGQYRRKRTGEQASESANGFHNTLHNRAKRRYYTLLEGDRRILDEYENPTLTLLSLRMSPQVNQRVDLLTELQSALSDVLNSLRYQLGQSVNGPQLPSDAYEYAYVVAGTDHGRATPHVHILIYTDSDVTESTFEPIVSKWVESNQYADERGHRTDSTTIRVESDIPRASNVDERNSKAAVYVGSQLPHIRPLHVAEYHDLIHDSVCHAVGESGFSKSRSWPVNVESGTYLANDEKSNIEFDISVAV
jgi:hypothetical protein